MLYHNTSRQSQNGTLIFAEMFTPGETPCVLAVAGHTIGIAICADCAQPTHPQAYAELGANIYAAGVFLHSDWYATDVPRLARYAVRYGMVTVMATQLPWAGRTGCTPRLRRTPVLSSVSASGGCRRSSLLIRVAPVTDAPAMASRPRS
jgi:hypothetical protein